MQNSAKIEKRLLQAAIALACLVPIIGGGLGILHGLGLLGVAAASASAEAHFRYLSGLLLGIGLGFLSMVPRIEAHSARFRLLAMIVVIGGLARLASLVLRDTGDAATLFALAMELGVTPLLALWQWRVSRAARCLGKETPRD